MHSKGLHFRVITCAHSTPLRESARIQLVAHLKSNWPTTVLLGQRRLEKRACTAWKEEGPAVTCAEDFDQLIKHAGVQFLACRSSAPKAPANRPGPHASGKRRAPTTLLVGKNLLKDQLGKAIQAYTNTGRLNVTRAEAELPHKEAALPPLAQAPAAQATSKCQARAPHNPCYNLLSVPWAA